MRIANTKLKLSFSKRTQMSENSKHKGNMTQMSDNSKHKGKLTQMSENNNRKTKRTIVIIVIPV